MARPVSWTRFRRVLTQIFSRRPPAAPAPRRADDSHGDGHERYRELFENSQGLICIHDLEGRLLDVNPAAARLLGHDCGELVGRRLDELLSPAVRAGFPAYLSRIRDQGEDSGLMRITSRHGAELVWMYRNVRLDRPGRPSSVLGYAIDVTERHRLEAEKQHYLDRIERQNLDLELRNREIEKANRLKSAFLAAMSHELRTPLTSIIGFSDLLAEAPERLDDQQQVYLGFIRQGARHLLQLINDVLDLSKIEAGKLELSRGQVDLCDVAAEALTLVEPLVAQHKIHLESDVPAAIEVCADRVRLKQILLNLLANAVKFTPPGGRVRLTASAVEGFACVAVSDTGVGIPAAEQESIFSEFHQAGITPRGLREGTGLGLAIVRRLVEQHGGRIWVESEPDRGSCFTFLVPSSHRERSTPAPPAAAGIAAAPRPRRVRPLVLVGDADAAARELLSSYLRMEGYDVAAVGGGAEVVATARLLQPDLITLEVAPSGGGDGWQALRDLRAAPETTGTAVVVVTVVDEKRQGFALGAADYLVKPVDREKLLQVVRRLAPLPAPAADAVLIIDHTAEGQRELVDAVLTAGYRPLAASDGKEALRLLGQVRPGALVVSLLLPDQDAFQTILRLRVDPLLSDLPVLALAPEELSPHHRELLASGPTHLISRMDRPWRETLVRELGLLLGSPGRS